MNLIFVISGHHHIFNVQFYSRCQNQRAGETYSANTETENPRGENEFGTSSYGSTHALPASIRHVMKINKL